MISKAQKDAENFRHRTGVDWIDSRTVTNCAECHDKFTVLNRKHHCRQCGQVICKKCSPERIVIGNERVRICQSCYDDLSIHGGGLASTSISSNEVSLRCFICNEAGLDKFATLVEGRIKGQDLIYWHSTCLKCCSCQKQLKFHETYIFPIIGNLEQQRPQCYCESHVPQVEAHHDLDHKCSTDLKPSASQPPTPNNPYQPLRVAYGPFTNTQYYLLHIPREKELKGEPLESTRSIPLVVVLHGGFWKSKYSISNSCVDNLPKFFMSAGIAVCLVEYRRVAAEHPDDEGGWPQTGDDILLALESLHSEVTRLNQEITENPSTRRPPIDLQRIVLLGHSAGGQLALWACCEPQLSKLHFKPMMCVGIAPVANLIQGQQMR